MIVLDVNVLIAAHRDDHPHHAVVRPWFDALITDGGGFCVPSTVWAGFLRITTHRRVFRRPSTIAESFAFLDAVVAQPGYLRIEPGPRHPTVLRRLCDEADVTANLVPDAVLGAIVVEHGATLATLDRDFSRFTSVTHVRPG